MKRSILWVIVLSLSFFPAAEGAVYKFDMGTKDSPVWDGFQRVTKDTAYTKENGYGWEKTVGLSDVARVPFAHGGRLRPDDLCGDFVTGATSPFLIDVPNGDYTIYLISGDMGDTRFYPAQSLLIKANGEEKYREDITADNFFTEKYFFRMQKKEWRKGDKIWETWVAPYFKPIVFSICVSDSRIALEFSPSCRINCVIVYSSSESVAMEKEITEITGKRKASFLDKYYEISPSASSGTSEMMSGVGSFEPTARQKENGYLLFARNYVEDVYPSSLPVLEQVGKELRLFVAKGESEPVTFCVFPFRDIKGATIQCTDLVDAEGNIIPASALEIYRVSYNIEPYFVVQDRNSYQIVPRFLRPNLKADYEAGVTRRVWIRVTPPENAKSSLYTGRVIFSPENAEPTELDLKVRVLPFSLVAMPNDVAFGFYYYPPDWTNRYFPDMKKFWDLTREELRLLQAYNFTSVLAGIQLPPIKMVDGTIRVDFEGSLFERFMEIRRELGIEAPLCWYHYTNNLLGVCRRLLNVPEKQDFYGKEQFDNPELREAMKSVTEQINDFCKKSGFPPIYYYLQDEYGARRGQIGVDWAKKITGIYHEVPGIKVCGGVCNDLEEQMIPFYDVSLINPAVLNLATVESVRRAGSPFGFYNVGGDRLSNGFYLWKMDGKIRMQWVFSSGNLGDPYNPLDGCHVSDLSIVFPSFEGPVPTVTMEIMREGLDDYRYCHTLALLIAQAEKSGRADALARAKNARGVLDGIMAGIRPDFQWYTKEGSFPFPDVYDKLRWRIAQEIMRLEEALK